MRQLLILTTIASLALSSAMAQNREYKLSKTAGKLKLNISNLTVEGYDGKEIIFTQTKASKEKEDSLATGLHLITAKYEDNTGIGLNISEKENVTEVNAVNSYEDNPVTVKVPNSVNVVIVYKNNLNSKAVKLRSFSGTADISVTYSAIQLENVTGPLNATTLYGKLVATFKNPVKGPIALTSVYGYADVSIPGDTKANVTLSTNYGKIYAADGLNIVREPKKEASGDGNADMEELTHSDDINGKLNGGGIDFIIKSQYGKIYLRKS